MRKEHKRRESIEQDLIESRELDFETSQRLAEAAFQIAEAEDTFRRLAEPELSRS